MIDRIIASSIRRRGAVVLVSLFFAAAGVYAMRITPIDAIPDLSEDAVIVYAEWAGHAPREVEDQVTYPLSLELQGLRGVRSVRTSSDFGMTTIQVILDGSTKVAEGRRLVGERLARAGASLPPGIAPKLGPDSPATGQIYWYSVEAQGIDLGRLRAVQDWYVKPQLASVPGVAEVASVGGYPIEYSVAVDPLRLRARGVTLHEIESAVARSNSSVGGHAVQKGNAEYFVSGMGWLGAGSPDGGAAVVRDLESVVLAAPGGRTVLLKDVADVSISPGPRRGVLEKDGGEIVGGVVLMASGENPLEVTRRIKARIHELEAGLPRGVSIRPFYDRTPLIEGAIDSVRRTIIEAMITATICVLVVLLHVRTSFVVAVTLPLTVLGSFLIMEALRRVGLVDVPLNIMSLAGIAISIGVLVDSSVVMAENVMHRLREHFGDRPARGDLRAIVLPACLEVGRPIFFSILIMLLSFLPVFALGGIEGKMFRPLALSKTLALATVAVLAVTLVPALCSILIRGRIRSEQSSPLVRGVIDVYRPVLSYLLEAPGALAWVIGMTFVVGLAPVGNRPLLLACLGASLLAVGLVVVGRLGRVAAMGSLVLVALAAESSMTPIAREFLVPMDEGMIMDMPITVPRASVAQSADDLKARDMILCRFPEVDMVVGKAGRAETPTDPAPMDMIETMVNFRPRDLWPRRSIDLGDATRQVARILDDLVARKLITQSTGSESAIEPCLAAVMPRFDVQMREYAYLRNAEFLRGEAAALGPPSHDGLTAGQLALWRDHVKDLDADLVERGAEVFTRLAIEDLLERTGSTDPEIDAGLAQLRSHREKPAVVPPHHGPSNDRHSMSRTPQAPALPGLPQLEAIQETLSSEFRRRLILWRKERADLVGFGSELDRAVQVPGWSNIWTMPIQNRVDMLATGVNTTVGVRVLGRSVEDVVAVSEAIARELKTLPGAADVVADPIRGKGYLAIRPDRPKAARLGVSVGDLNDAVEIALGGRIATSTVEGRERRPVRIRYARDFRADEDSAAKILVPTAARGPDGRPRFVALEQVADVRIGEGPATIKGEDGLLRNYVRLNVKGRGVVDFVEEARRVVSTKVALPIGVAVDWTGQFEHEVRARRTLLIVLPVILLLILGILYWTYHDLVDAALMLLAVPGAIAGGVFFQWLMGFPFSVTVWIGYLACFGMATSTGIIMLVYLRDAVARHGGLEGMTPGSLRLATLEGAVHRLRPKLLTEGTTILGLAPVLWADGPGADVIRPMAAPVLGGLLIADEVIDLLLPVLFYHVRKRRLGRLDARPEPPADAGVVAVARAEGRLADGRVSESAFQAREKG
ncbi:efflux RND transporter permease subunit [Paludisphaera mucosa]|uniref:Efflux RND transporter permease subunit n=1 Tax=Paludisphaera mucosa TaxID=3030827 RepID=A0ABT6F6T2_9BACT|nr:efflux RND transporter permease subunit [Paludisphaera mucosa]MDG3003191.1 efflux RND transporter permease subunit [Paludisphaera mucosa]